MPHSARYLRWRRRAWRRTRMGSSIPLANAEASFSVDGQPISDQQSRIFSNQISVSTIQEMRTLQGAPPAEFGDKTSLIVEATTRSGLGTNPTSGSVTLGYGSFQTPTAGITLATGGKTFG